MHDVAIIYAPEPYILAVCTNRGHSYDSWYVESDYEPFLKISEWIEEVSPERRVLKGTEKDRPYRFQRRLESVGPAFLPAATGGFKALEILALHPLLLCIAHDDAFDHM